MGTAIPAFGIPADAQAGLRFGQRPDQRERNRKAVAYFFGWKKLIEWDRKTHAQPVLADVKLGALLDSARRFLSRQAKVDTSDAVPFIIGISGSPAAGKTTIKNAWMREFKRSASRMLGWKQKRHGPVAEELEMDNYMRDTSDRRRRLGDDVYFTHTNFDDPRAVSLDRIRRDLFRLKNGQATRTQHYSFNDASVHLGQKLTVPAPFILTEGFLAFLKKPVRNLMDLKIFFTVADETIHKRWWQRASERDCDNEAGKAMFRRAMEGYRKNTEPTRQYADVVINSNAPLADVTETVSAVTRLLLRTFYPAQHR